MANQKAFYAKSDQLRDKGQETYIDFALADGFLVVIDDEWVLVHELYEGVWFFPDFVKTQEDVQAFIRISNSTHQKGIEQGKKFIKQELKALLT